MYGCLLQVNQGFDRLRQYVRLPGLSKKKLSKVDTLRAAVVYIKHLQSLLDETNAVAASVPTYHATEQLMSCQQQYQQQHLDAAFFRSLLDTNTKLSVQSHDLTESTSGLLATASTPLEPAPVSYTHLTLPTKRIV